LILSGYLLDRAAVFLKYLGLNRQDFIVEQARFCSFMRLLMAFYGHLVLFFPGNAILAGYHLSGPAHAFSIVVGKLTQARVVFIAEAHGDVGHMLNAASQDQL